MDETKAIKRYELKISHKIWKTDWSTVLLIINQSIRSVLLAWGGYIAWAIGYVGVFILVNSTLGEIRTGYSTVIYEPMVIPLMGMSVVVGVFISISAGLSLAREREHGTLETLFYSPISYREYIFGKILGYWVSYIFIILLFIISLLIIGWITNFIFTNNIIIISMLSIFVIFALTSWGVLVAAFMRTMRGTLFLLIGLLVLFLGLPLIAILMNSIVSSQNFTNLVILRDSIQFLSRIISIISPIAFLFNGSEAILRNNIPEFVSFLFYSLIYGLAIMCLAVRCLRWRGIAQ